jgi:hypothetical protein
MTTLVDSKDIKDAGNAFDSGSLIIDPSDSQKLYMATQGPHQKSEDGGVMYSDNGGKKWTTIGWHLKDYTKEDKQKRGAKTDLLVEYLDGESNLYVANYGNNSSQDLSQGGIYLLEGFDGSIDTAAVDFWNANWKKIFPSAVGEYLTGVHKLAIRETFNTIYLGVDSVDENEHGLYKVVKLGESWTSEGPVWSDEPDSLFNNSIRFNDLETDPVSGNIYIATNTGLFMLDGTDNITQIDVPQFQALIDRGVDPEAVAVEIYPGNTNILYLASPITGVLRSEDKGVTWNDISSDIPTQGFIVLKVDPSSDVIYAEAAGAGIWKRSFSASQ